ncbi:MULTISPECIES: winged helix-turn-helix domain-containing protein [unclassified Nonomuraea]|uniref:winged helix-turn-helix domain-containing protein n=1 Tax=unclassified Nonomuraea TaxID=2593643 RepID=UPI0033992D91
MLLTARTEEVDRIIAFTAGSDDYVTKPFSARELALRARAILRRAEISGQAAEDRTLRFDGLVIDPNTRTVTVGADRTPELSALDFDLLVALAQAPGRVFTRRGLIEHVWGNDFFGDERVVDVHVRTLRRALGDDASTPRTSTGWPRGSPTSNGAAPAWSRRSPTRCVRPSPSSAARSRAWPTASSPASPVRHWRSAGPSAQDR